MKNKKIIIITAIILVVVTILIITGFIITNNGGEKVNNKSTRSTAQPSSTIDTTSESSTTETNNNTNKKNTTPVAEEEGTNNTDTSTKDNEYHIDDDTISSNSDKSNTTTQDTSTGPSTPETTTTSTDKSKEKNKNKTSEKTTAAPEPTHNHSYSPTYGTTNVQQYASDGTTNDYSRPIYSTRQAEKTREVPVYETHMIDINGGDATTNWENYGRAEWQSSGNWNDYASDYQNMKTWLLATIGSSAMSKQDIQVGTTTETYYETEEVITGYEQLGTTSKKTITGYTCSCGNSISVAKYISQYGTPSGYYLDSERLIKK